MSLTARLNEMSLKTVFNDEIRRVALGDHLNTVKKITTLVRSQFAALSESPAPVDLKYVDDEGDLVTVRRDAEFEEAIAVAKHGGKCLRLLVSVPPPTKATKKLLQLKKPQLQRSDKDNHWRTKKKNKGSPKLGAVFVKDVTAADGSSVVAGQIFTKTWSVKNSGNAPWPPNTALVCVGGQLEAKITRVIVPEADAGAVVDLSVELAAPDTAGQAKSVWRLQAANGHRFGHFLWTDVVVVDTPPPQPPQPPAVHDESKDDGADSCCPRGHKLLSFSAPHGRFSCDVCKGPQPLGAWLLGCRECDWDRCTACSVALAVQQQQDENEGEEEEVEEEEAKPQTTDESQSDADSEHTAQLQALMQMGFADAEKNAALLVAHNGNLQVVVSALLRAAGSQLHCQ